MAAREDSSVADLVTAVAESLGDTVVTAPDTLDGHLEPPPSAERPLPSAERTIPKTATLAQAGLLDGHVLTVSNDVVTVDDQVFASADGPR